MENPIEIVPNETLITFNGEDGYLDDDGTFHPGHGPGGDSVENDED